MFAHQFPLFAFLTPPHTFSDASHPPPTLGVWQIELIPERPLPVLCHYQRHRADLEEEVLLFHVTVLQLVGSVRTIHSIHQLHDFHQGLLIFRESEIKCNNEQRIGNQLLKNNRCKDLHWNFSYFILGMTTFCSSFTIHGS